MHRITEFEWDKTNAGHIMQRHGLSPLEVEEVFHNGPVVHKVRHDRFTAYGQTDEGRYLTVIFELKYGGVVRVVTARDMTRRERRLYKQRRRN